MDTIIIDRTSNECGRQTSVQKATNIHKPNSNETKAMHRCLLCQDMNQGQVYSYKALRGKYAIVVCKWLQITR